jgi:hypothetical protein
MPLCDQRRAFSCNSTTFAGRLAVKNLLLDRDDLGVIHAKKVVGHSRIWLTEKPDVTWWVVVRGPDERLRIVGFALPPQERRARDTYEALSMLHVLGAFLEGQDS